MEKKINLIGISGRIGSGKDTVAGIIRYLTMRTPSMGRQDSFSVPTWEIKKYAYKLKQMVSLLTGIPVEDLEKEEVKSRQLGKEWDIRKETQPCGCDRYMHHYHSNGKCNNCDEPTKVEFIPQTVREVLQKLGTEGVRNTIHPNAWVNALFADYTGFVEKAHSGSILEENCYNHYKCPSCGHAFLGYKRQSRCKECIEVEGPIYPSWLITDCRFPNEAQAIKDRGGIVIRVNRPKQVRTDFDGSGTNYKLENFDPSNIQHKKIAMMEAMNPQVEHPSETSLDNWDFDYEIENNGSLQFLEEKVKLFLMTYNLI